ncbi:MAG: diguanylate cyclase [Gammaproteobacteria bacterium]|uniref:GGDEF domain-containing protein n=1 Tax=Rhodoferax sp. TaxID=50421 RepID=UPI001792036A|nr:GGDEF domain-containing protein [Rhodoferax sp.]MBU3901010.1 diguanylate cyclase [Gammaproteobacteria bacterium]MBA3058298.1 GGDEF domain-containing protein [Rhodoferax sp.]MBU3996761.1 diguanylate cyclase [Gammaproteobacteria bacterium]MBU4017684.1 diguanylate cyclase [Gammaproteobacteria bacterium]MBU4081127.1 diguanylate cyclase [Gammaproteobacteria bacterium]
MKTDRNVKLKKSAKSVKSLTQVLKESKHVKEIVKESADELASVNKVFQHELATQEHLPKIEEALEQSEAVETKVQEASVKLANVNQALQDEVKERHLLERELATVLKQQEETLHAALHDSLTGLPNRALFNDRLEHGLVQAARHGWTLAVMFMDLNNFKAINDLYGHDIGDEVLRIVAARLEENTRGEDTVSRHGGDEFLYLLMDMNNEDDASVIAKKIIEAVQVPCKVRVGELIITPSIGISIFPKDGSTAQALTQSADTAMYQAKRSKSGYAFANIAATSQV